MWEGYWRSVCHLAWRQSAKSFGIESRTALVIRSLVVAAVIGALLFAGSKDASLDEMIGRIGACLFIVFGLIVFAAWNALKIPPALDKEKSNQLLLLERKIDEMNEIYEISTLSLNFTSETRGYIIAKGAMVARVRLSGVSISGRWAKPEFGLDGVTWRWTPIAIEDRLFVGEGEVIHFPYISRLKMSEAQTKDEISLFGQIASLPSSATENGQLVLMDIQISTNEGKARYRRLWKFFATPSGQKLDALDIKAHKNLDMPI